MPDDPELTPAESTPEASTPTPTPEPAAPEPEPDPVPDWLFAPPPMAPPPPQQFQPHYQQPPPPQYQQPPTPQIPLEEFVQRPRDVIRREAREEAMNQLLPLASRLMEVDNFTRQQHMANLQRMDVQARTSIADGYKAVAKDPGFKDNGVRGVFDQVVAGYLSKARNDAMMGDFRGLYQFQNPKFIKAAMELAKVHVGYTAPEPINVRGGDTESSRSMPQSAPMELDQDMEYAARDLAIKTGRPIEEVKKKMRDSLEQRRKERWS